MSSALSSSTHRVGTRKTTISTTPAGRLRSVDNPGLSITSAAALPTTDVRQAARIGQVARDPREEYAPSDDPRLQFGQSNVFRLRRVQGHKPAGQGHLRLMSDIKKMTQAIGSAFIEAELGIRPFAQLASWLEHELFHKLKPRVHYQAQGNHAAARRGERTARKLPVITPIGVRASVRHNGEWESSITIRVGDRARAIAMRLQLHRNRWRVIALEVG